MTMSEIAKQLHTSRNTIYKRLKGEGVDLETLRDETGALTQYGMSLIADLFSDDVSKTVTDDTAMTDKERHEDTENGGKVTFEYTKEQFETAVKLVRAEEQLKAAAEKIASLERENAFLKEQLSAWQNQTKLLQASAAESVSVWERMKRLFVKRHDDVSKTVTDDTTMTGNK